MVNPDFERLGIFKEMSYHTLRDPFIDHGRFPRRSAFEGKQMYCGGSKTQSSNSDGYFDKFFRIFVGDNKKEFAKILRQQRIASSKLNKGKQWIPPNPTHKLLGLGSSYDTFSGPITYFRQNCNQKTRVSKDGKNFYTSPGKKGSSSYADVSIGKYPSHTYEPYDQKSKHQPHSNKKCFYLNMHPVEYFDMNPFKPFQIHKRPIKSSSTFSTKTAPIFKPSSTPKLDGGCKDGCFSPFPTYTSDRVRLTRSAPVKTPPFKPSFGPKPYPIVSIVNMNVKLRINSANYKHISSHATDR